MKEKFELWNTEKQIIHFWNDVAKYPKAREIWYTKMWINIWDEENWKEKFQRPVLILKKIWNIYFCVALSTKNKESFFYKRLEKVTFYEWYEVENSVIIVSQGKIFDKKRFIKQIGYLEKWEFEEIKKLLKNIYF